MAGWPKNSSGGGASSGGPTTGGGKGGTPAVQGKGSARPGPSGGKTAAEKRKEGK